MGFAVFLSRYQIPFEDISSQIKLEYFKLSFIKGKYATTYLSVKSIWRLQDFQAPLI